MKVYNYIFRHFLTYVLYTIGLCLFLFNMFDFIHKSTTYFMKYQPKSELILKFYYYQIPIQLVQILPIAALLGGVVTMVILARSNEISAMRAAGLHPWRLAIPLAFGGILLTLMIYAIDQWVLPIAAQRMHYVTDVLIEGKPASLLSEDAHWTRSQDEFFHFGDYNPRNRCLSEIKLFYLDRQFHITQSLYAERAELLDEKTGVWRIHKVVQQYFARDGQFTHAVNSDQQDLELPVDVTRLLKDRRRADELSLLELDDRIKDSIKLGNPFMEDLIAWHMKMAYPLVALLMSLMGLSFAFLSERTTEAVRGVAVAMAIGLSYWFIQSAGKALATTSIISPLLGAWLANDVMILVILVQFWRLQRI